MYCFCWLRFAFPCAETIDYDLNVKRMVDFLVVGIVIFFCIVTEKLTYYLSLTSESKMYLFIVKQLDYDCSRLNCLLKCASLITYKLLVKIRTFCTVVFLIN